MGAHRTARHVRVHSDTDVPHLVQAARAGDRQAFAELYRRYAGMVYSIAASRVPDEAADVVQEVFLRALRKLKALRDATAFRAWLVAIARNATRDVEQQSRGRFEVDHEPRRRETQHDQMVAQAAARAIRALPHAYRTTMRLRLIEGLTGPEIAHRTGLGVASVRVNLHRGMKLLRQRLTAPAPKRSTHKVA